MNNISVVFADKGNSPHLQKMLQSIEAFASEIIVGDIGLDAAVKEKLERNNKVKIVPFKKDVKYVELIREEMHSQATGNYILVLDPDEQVPASLLDILRESIGKYDYVKIPRKNIIFGKWIQHSRWWPDYQVRFFKKGMVTWPKVLHTQPVVSGRELILDAKEEQSIVHNNYVDLDEYLLKAPRYAKAQAQEDIKKGSQISFGHYAKQALSEFIGRYFADNGYKDGMHGFSLAFLQMIYYFLVYFYAWELGGYAEVSQKNVIQDVLKFFSNALFEVSHWGKQKGLSNISFVKSKLHSIIRKIT